MEGERAAVHVRCGGWGGGGDEGAGRTSKRAFRKRISSLHPHKEKYVIAGRQHYFGLLRGGETLVWGNSTMRTSRGDACTVLRGHLLATSRRSRSNFCVCSKLPLQRAAPPTQSPPPSDKTDAQQMASNRWYRSGPVGRRFHTVARTSLLCTSCAWRSSDEVLLFLLKPELPT